MCMRWAGAAIQAHNLASPRLYDGARFPGDRRSRPPRDGPTVSTNLSFPAAGWRRPSCNPPKPPAAPVYLRVVELAGFIRRLRASLQCYNRSEDVAALVSALQTLKARRTGLCPIPGLGRRPVFQDLDESRQPGVGLVPVDHAMVDGQRDIGHRPDQDRVLAVRLRAPRRAFPACRRRGSPPGRRGG